MIEYLEFAKDISFMAKEVMLTYFNEENVSSYKDDDTIEKSDYDLKILNHLIK